MQNGPNPAFLHDEIRQSEVETILQCSNSISGLDATACQDPLCSIENKANIASTDLSLLSSSTGLIEKALQYCASCKVVHQDNISAIRPIFEYDCLTTLPDLKCPILLANGECRFEPLEAPPKPENTTYWNVPSFLLTRGQNENELEPGWTLNNIDATTFNVLADIFDKIVMVLFSAVVGLLYPLYLSLQVHRGKKAVEAPAVCFLKPCLFHLSRYDFASTHNFRALSKLACPCTIRLFACTSKLEAVEFFYPRNRVARSRVRLRFCALYC